MATLILGCFNRVVTAPLNIRTAEDTVMLIRNRSGAAFNVTVVVKNGSSDPLYLNECGTEAQREIEGRWYTVWSPVCLTSGPLTIIQSGDSVAYPLHASASASPTSFPRLDSRLTAGRYRLLLAVGFYKFPTESPQPLPAENRVSSTFVMKETSSRQRGVNVPVKTQRASQLRQSN
jgi:hypothetical protein